LAIFLPACWGIQSPFICSAQDYLGGQASGRQILRERGELGQQNGTLAGDLRPHAFLPGNPLRHE